MTGRRYEGSGRQFDVTVMRSVMIPMRDGVGLATDLFLPAYKGRAATGEFPVLVERTPYGRTRSSLQASGRFFAEHGYVCAIQDVRGRYESEGDFDLDHFRSKWEGPDGYDTIEWLSEQPWSSGTVGTFGGSYTGQNQQAAAVLRPPHLGSMFIRDCALDNWRGPVRKNGAFNQVILLRLAYRMAKDGVEARNNPRLAAFLDAEFRQIGKYLNSFPLKPGHTTLAQSPTWEKWYFDVARRSDFGSFWSEASSSQDASIEAWKDVPVCFVSGWYGHHLQQNFEKYQTLRSILSSPVRLIVGPWLHGSMLSATSAGQVDFGPGAVVGDVDQVRLRWFDQTLKGLDTGFFDSDDGILYFTMGGGSGARTGEARLSHGGRWRSSDTWPPSDSGSVVYYLHGDGSLASHSPPPDGGASTYTYDPKDPVPTVGGNFHGSNSAFFGVSVSGEGGAADQRGDPATLSYCRDSLPLATRQDVLVFQTPPLPEDIEVTGELVAKIWVSSSAPDTDFTAKLVDVHPPNGDYPEGFAMNLLDTIVRMRYRNGRTTSEAIEPHKVYELEVHLGSTSNIFARGHRIRLDISSSNFPAYDVNPNTGGRLAFAGPVRCAENSVYHSDAYASHVLLPVRTTGDNTSASASVDREVGRAGGRLNDAEQ